jgi:hypothetical protein
MSCSARATPWCTPPAGTRWSRRWPGCGRWPVPGHVVIHSRNWEKLHAERRIVQVADRVQTRGGRRCVVLYAWEVPDRLDQEHSAHVVFAFEDGDRIEPQEYRVSAAASNTRLVADRNPAERAAAWPCGPADAVRRLAIASLVGLHTARFWMYLRPGHGRRLPDTRPTTR